MARQVKERIDPVNAAVREASPVAAQVAARPSGPQSAPTVFDPGMDIARSLAGLNPGLTKYLGTGIKEQQEDERMAGMKARSEQADFVPVAMTREQSASWQQGYMEMHGKLMIARDRSQMREFFEKNKESLTPEQFESFLAEQRKSRLEGFDDPDALKTYLPGLVQEEDHLRGEFARVNVLKARLQEAEYATVSINKHITDSREMDVPTAVAGREALFNELRQQTGITRPEFTQRYIQSLLADPTATQQDFQVLYAAGPDGVAPVDAVDSQGNPFKPAIERARAQAQDREERLFAEQQKEHATTFINWTVNQLESNPLSIENPAEFVYSRAYKGGPFDGPGVAAQWVVKIEKAQEEAREGQRILELIQNNTPVPAMLREHKEFKKYVARAFDNNWQTVNWDDATNVKQRMTMSAQLTAQLGEPDPFLKSLGAATEVYGVTKDASGTEVMSTNLKAAYSVWKSMKGSDVSTHALALFPDRAQAYLTVFDNAVAMGATTGQAVDMARKALDPESITLMKAAWVNPQQRKDAMSSAAKKFESFSADVSNKGYVGRTIVEYAESLHRLSNGNLPMDQAIERATEKFKATHAHDGFGAMVQIPATLDREQATERFKPWLAEVAHGYSQANYGKRLENYHVQYAQQDGRHTWTVIDELGQVVGSTAEWSTLDQQWRRANGVTFEQSAANWTDRATKPAEQGPFTPHRSLWADYRSGKISEAQFREGRAAEKKQKEVAIETNARTTVERMQAVPKLPPADLQGVNLRVRTPQPTGPEMNTKEMSLQFLQTNPDFALTVAGEGFRNVVYRDTGGTRAIGLGYNIDARGGDDVARKDFARIGITDPDRQSRILAGKEAITADEGVRLYEVIKKEYSTRAASQVGKETWDALRPHQQAVLTDLAYQTGKGTFTKVWEKLKAGDAAGATDVLAAAMKERGSGAKRRMALRLALWESPDRFSQLVQQGI
jgi:GH24 family phage-related lysozyme (muramidase)